jgi:hypothetical protein
VKLVATCSSKRTDKSADDEARERLDEMRRDLEDERRGFPKRLRKVLRLPFYVGCRGCALLPILGRPTICAEAEALRPRLLASVLPSGAFKARKWPRCRRGQFLPELKFIGVRKEPLFPSGTETIRGLGNRSARFHHRIRQLCACRGPFPAHIFAAGDPTAWLAI